MNPQRRWIPLDTFKLVVALVLLLLILFLRQPPGWPAAIAGQETPSGVAAPAQTPSLTGEASQAETQVMPTDSPMASLTPMVLSPASTVTPLTSTLASQPQTTVVNCPLAQPSQLAVGDQAQVTTNLNIRQGAGMDKLIIGGAITDSIVEVIGGPICTPYQNGAYLWWNVKTAGGQTGWSAEASLSQGMYFLKPVP